MEILTLVTQPFPLVLPKGLNKNTKFPWNSEKNSSNKVEIC